jgi:hypothetical protein
VAGLLTTVNEAVDRVAMHAVRRELLVRRRSRLAFPRGREHPLALSQRGAKRPWLEPWLPPA